MTFCFRPVSRQGLLYVASYDKQIPANRKFDAYSRPLKVSGRFVSLKKGFRRTDCGSVDQPFNTFAATNETLGTRLGSGVTG